MKHFTSNLLAFVIPLVILLIAVEVFLRNIPDDFSYKSTYIKEHAQDIEVLILGSSHTYFGVDPTYFKKKSFNLAYTSRLLFYDIQIFNKYKSDLKQLRYVFIPIDYFSLFVGRGITKWSFRESRYYRDYNVGKPNFSLSNLEIVQGNCLSRMISYAGKGDKVISCNKLGWGVDLSLKENQDLQKSAIRAAKVHVEGSGEHYFQQNVKQLRGILAYAQKHNITIIFISCPAYKTYVDLLDTNRLNKGTQALEGMIRDYPSSRYFSFLRDKSFVAADFHDADHLNVFGTKKFSLKLDSLVEALDRE